MSISAITAVATSPIVKSALQTLIPVIHEVLGGGKIADKVIGKIRLKALDIDGQKISAQQQILKLELEGSWLQRNWRPITMIVFVFIIFFQVVIIPIINAIYGTGTIVYYKDITLKIIDVILVGIGAYIGGRSIEKVATNIIAFKSNRTLVTENNDGLKPVPVPKDASIEHPPFMRRD